MIDLGSPASRSYGPAADGDGRADVTAGSGEGLLANVRVCLGKSFTSAAEPTTFRNIPVFGGASLAGGVYVG